MRSRHGARLLLGAALAVAGCYQPLDTGAARGGPSPTAVAAVHTVALETPPIALDDQGNTTTDPCVPTRAQSRALLATYCARCHGGQSAEAHKGRPPFDFVLDAVRLKTATSATAKDPATAQPARFLVPGVPRRSRLYLRIADGEMPPADVVGLPSNPRPTISDVSILYEWIAHCIGSDPARADGGAR